MKTLKGFERDLMKIIASGFRWTDEKLKAYPLIEGRSLFAQDLPDVETIEKAAPTGGLPFDKLREPSLVIYRQPATRRRARGGSFEFSALLVLRCPGSLQRAVDLLDELDDWISDEETALIGAEFKIGAVTVIGEATAFSRGGDDASFASSTVRLLAVPLTE